MRAPAASCPEPESAHLTKLAMTSNDKRANLKLGIILASVAVVFFVGFIAKVVLLGR